ncbi:hypothetical protein EV699_1331, partial [Plasticicumulans lactativorans]
MAKRAKKKGVSLNRYRSVWEMRSDGWIHLTDDLGRLLELAPDSDEYTQRHARVRETLATLTPIESY